MSAKTLYFVRHGEADYNLLDRVNADPGVRNNLTVAGHEQAVCCRTAFGPSPVEVIYCSEFPRTRQTAEILNQLFKVPIVVDPRINETGAFAFEGMPARLWHAAQVPDRMTAAVAGCESFTDFRKRLEQFLLDLCSVPQRHILVVSHEEPIQVMVGMLEGVADVVARARPVSHCYPISVALAGCKED
jgi:broad specificity phosphatase PhoE